MAGTLVRVALIGLLLAPVGCANGLAVTRIAADASKPANVRLLLSVDDDNAKTPVLGLGSDAFRVYEDGIPITAKEELSIASPDMSASHYTLLLLDFSGQVAVSPEADSMIDGAMALVGRLRPTQKLAVYVFDGAPDLLPVAPFTATATEAATAIVALALFQPRDASSNLNAATVQALKVLQQGFGGDALATGSLIVVYHQGDRTARMTSQDLASVARLPEYERIQRYALEVGDAAKSGSVADALKAEPIALQPTEVAGAVGGLADRLVQLVKSYYLIAICSHAREGTHRLRIEVSRKITGENGKEEEQSGSLFHPFSADGFGPGCIAKGLDGPP